MALYSLLRRETEQIANMGEPPKSNGGVSDAGTSPDQLMSISSADLIARQLLKRRKRHWTQLLASEHVSNALLWSTPSATRCCECCGYPTIRLEGFMCASCAICGWFIGNEHGPLAGYIRSDIDIQTCRRNLYERDEKSDITLSDVIECYDAIAEISAPAEVVSLLANVARAWERRFSALEAVTWDSHRDAVAAPPTEEALQHLSRDEFEALQRRRTMFEELVRFVDDCAVCPSCGYPTLTRRRNDDICSLCDWQDDGLDDPDADSDLSGPNRGLTLTGARAAFIRQAGDHAKVALLDRFHKALSDRNPEHFAMLTAEARKLRDRLG